MTTLVFSFGIPTGETGEKGARGPEGPVPTIGNVTTTVVPVKSDGTPGDATVVIG